MGTGPVRGDSGWSLQWRHGGGDAVQRFGVDPVVRPLSALLATDETAVDEQLHMVGHRGLAQAERFGEVADAGFATVGCGNERHQLDPSRAGQRFEHRGEAFGGRTAQHAASQRRATSYTTATQVGGWLVFVFAAVVVYF